MHAILLLTASVAATTEEAMIDFDHQIIPVLTKAGCNAGACHGAAVGRGGFRLSLYGGDPAFDFRSIVRELQGRRVNLARPDESLLLLKPTESIEHGGGTRLELEGDGANLLRTWIRQGALRSQRKRLVQFRVAPNSYVADAVNATVQFEARARFKDGSDIDVTKWTVFTAEDTSAVEIDPFTARAKVARRGRHIVVARYLDRVVPCELFLPLADEAVRLEHASRKNFIDDEVLRVLSQMRIPIAPPADDATFLRRLTLDLTGRLPTIATAADFMRDPNPEKRARLIDGLLASEEFTEYWTLQLARLLRIRSQPKDSQGARVYHTWLKEQVAQAVPYDQIVRTLLTSIGDTHTVGPANFYRTVSGPREQAEFTSELLMGSRLRCANCHNHPLDRWTQDDYHGLAAVFANLNQGREITLDARGEVTHPRTGEPARPRIPGERFLDEGSDGREAFAGWLTNARNPYFAKAFVNRLWKAMMGRGLVEPSDDFRDTNPPTHPVLLDRLAQDFIEHGYDLRHTLRTIAHSAAYARSAAGPLVDRTDDAFYSCASVRPLEPEVLADAISDVLGVFERYGNEPGGTRAVSLFDSTIPSGSLDILGRCSREQSCESATSFAGGLPRMLHLLNGPLINQRVSDPQGRLNRLVEAGRPLEEIVKEFYLCALGRQPQENEAEYWSAEMRLATTSEHRRQLLEDFVWSLLICREFVTNH